MENAVHQAPRLGGLKIKRVCPSSSGGLLLGAPEILDIVVDQRHEASSHNDISHIGDGIKDCWVGDPHMARGNPATGVLVRFDLVRASHLRSDVSNRRSVPVTDEVESGNVEVLVNNTTPGIRVSPPVESIVLRAMPSLARDVDTSVVAELELDRVGWDKYRSGWRRLVASPRISPHTHGANRRVIPRRGTGTVPCGRALGVIRRVAEPTG
jgi:hypothetical protein